MTTPHPPDDSTPASAGHLIGGRYQLVNPIASGGMARVWEGRDTVLSRPVAIKILHPHLATDRGFLLRFRREAVAAARLSHRSIVSIYDTVSQRQTEAIVMELVHGETLRSILDGVKRLSPADAIELGLQISDALDEAHRAGIVHRDIKPSNIILCPDRRIMVTDFGIAKASEDTDLTVTGTLLGTAKYLAPEQVLGDPVDPRADLYSLGVLLFETLTGRAPFQADTDAATALARLHQDAPSVSAFQPDVPSDLDQIVTKLMCREPGERFASAKDLHAALSGVRPEYVHPDRTLVLGHDASEQSGLGEDDYGEEREESFLRSERSWMLPAMALILIATGLLVAGVLLSRSEIGQRVFDSNADGSAATAGEGPQTNEIQPGEQDRGATMLSPIQEVVDPRIVGATAIDFQGDGDENGGSVHLAFDGDDQTAWRSETYRGPLFGRLKTGIGYLIDLGGNAHVSTIDLETNTRDWSISFYLLEEFFPDEATWGVPIAIAMNESRSEKFRVEGTGRYLLLWVTNPGRSDDGPDEDEEDDYRFELAEIKVS